MSSILVVDDDQNLATVLKTLLTHNGNVVDVVNTATDAKAILEQRMFDLVITICGYPTSRDLKSSKLLRPLRRIRKSL
jgi:DNA-binding response OmpR family regulator